LGYLYLLIAIVGEVIATTYLKSTNNFTEVMPTTYVVTGYGIAFYFMMLAMKTLPVAITYSIWSGVGISAITILGALKYKEGTRPNGTNRYRFNNYWGNNTSFL
jgi:small multidrug resistance pump